MTLSEILEHRRQLLNRILCHAKSMTRKAQLLDCERNRMRFYYHIPDTNERCPLGSVLSNEAIDAIYKYSHTYYPIRELVLNSNVEPFLRKELLLATVDGHNDYLWLNVLKSIQQVHDDMEDIQGPELGKKLHFHIETIIHRYFYYQEQEQL